MNNNGRLAQFKSEYGRTPTREELLDYIRSQKQNESGVNDIDKTIDMAKSYRNQEEIGNVDQYTDKLIDSSKGKQLDNFIPQLNNNILAGEDASIPSAENQIPTTQSATAKSIKLAANRPTSVSPVVSPESQSAGIGETPAPTDYTQDPEMQAAQAEAFRRNQTAMMLEAGRQISQGLGGLGSGQKVQLEDQAIKGMLDKSNAPVEQLAQAREALIKRLSMAKEQDKVRPDSHISQMTRLLAMRAGMSAKDVNGKSAADLEPIIKGTIDLREMEGRERDRELQRQIMLDKHNEDKTTKSSMLIEKKAVDELSDFNKNKANVKNDLDKLDDIISMLEKNKSKFGPVEGRINSKLGLDKDFNQLQSEAAALSLTSLGSALKGSTSDKDVQLLKEAVLNPTGNPDHIIKNLRRKLAADRQKYNQMSNAADKMIVGDKQGMVEALYSPLQTAKPSQLQSDMVTLKAVSGPNVGKTKVMSADQAQMILNSPDGKDYQVVK